MISKLYDLGISLLFLLPTPGSKKNRCLTNVKHPAFKSLLVFYFNDFFFVVASASFANSVRHHESTTFAAFY